MLHISKKFPDIYIYIMYIYIYIYIYIIYIYIYIYICTSFKSGYSILHVIVLINANIPLLQIRPYCIGIRPCCDLFFALVALMRPFLCLFHGRGGKGAEVRRGVPRWDLLNNKSLLVAGVIYSLFYWTCCRVSLRVSS